MLFDLRSRGRRRVVQVVYLGLAVLIGGGLVLFGVGTGTGGGGLLNGLGGGGSGGAQNQVIGQQVKSAEKQARLNPDSAAAWANLINASYTSATGDAADYNSTTNTFTAAGRKALATTVGAWQHYQSLTKTPDPTLATLSARAYAQLGDYASAANVWQVEIQSQPGVAKGYECLAVNAFAAKNNRLGELALGKALSLTAQAGQATLKTEILAAKAEPTIAQTC